MKLWLVFTPALAALGIAAASGCQTQPASTAGCNLSAASALLAETTKPGCGAAWIDANVRINELQAIGTHNSYKQQIPEIEMALIRERSPQSATGLDYSHEPIPAQLDRGARQLEIDPSDDPQGGLFTTPLAPRLLKAAGKQAPAYDLSVMSKPGIKVIHAPDIDYRSHCLLFVDCLRQVKQWSDKNPTHAPILIMINPKSSGISWEGAAKVLPWGKDAYERMDAEIRSVFPASQIIEPDDVRGSHATLREAVMNNGWPKLGEARGKVIFAIDLSPKATEPYAVGHPSLKGRVAFMTTYPEAPEAAYFTMNDPEREQALIQERVKQGFLIRTRADADTREARTGETKRREAALASGAQFISTDYMTPDARFNTGYTAVLPAGAKTRCNPLAKAACAGVAAE